MTRTQSMPSKTWTSAGSGAHQNWLCQPTSDRWRFTEKDTFTKVAPQSNIGLFIPRVQPNMLPRKPLPENWKTRHWATLNRTNFNEKPQPPHTKFGLKTANWFDENHPFWGERWVKGHEGFSEYGKAYEMPPPGWPDCAAGSDD